MGFKSNRAKELVQKTLSDIPIQAVYTDRTRETITRMHDELAAARAGSEEGAASIAKIAEWTGLSREQVEHIARLSDKHCPNQIAAAKAYADAIPVTG